MSTSSHAQRDLIDLTLVEAAMRSGDPALARAPLLSQVVILGATWCVVAFAVMSVYAAIGAKLSTGVDSLNARGIFNRITGGIFIAAGGMLAWTKRLDA